MTDSSLKYSFGVSGKAVSCPSESLPETGTVDTIYYDADEEKIYVWNGTEYVEFVSKETESSSEEIPTKLTFDSSHLKQYVYGVEESGDEENECLLSRHEKGEFYHFRLRLFAGMKISFTTYGVKSDGVLYPAFIIAEGDNVYSYIQAEAIKVAISETMEVEADDLPAGEPFLIINCPSEYADEFSVEVEYTTEDYIKGLLTSI